MYKFMIRLISMMSFLNTHQPAMFNVYVHIFDSLLPLLFFQLDFVRNYLSLVHWTDCRERHRAYI